ncbi:MAG: hypothetical protein V3V04_05875 [Rhizobiaceae bacterium]
MESGTINNAGVEREAEPIFIQKRFAVKPSAPPSPTGARSGEYSSGLRRGEDSCTQ